MKSETGKIQSQSAEDLAEVINLQSEIANSPRQVSGLMTLVCERTQVLARATGATVEMHEGDEMVYRACTGTLSNSLGVRLKVDSSLSGLSVQSGALLYCEDSEIDERVNREACRRVGARSMICVPLNYLQKNVGVLKVVSSVAHAFSDREISLLRLIAGVLSSSIAQGTSRQSLQESELKFRTLTETAVDGILISENGISAEANPAFCSLFGYDPEEIFGLSILEYVSQELKERTKEYVRIGYNLPYETVCRRKDNSTFLAEINARSVDLAGKSVRVTTVRDITERKLIEASLKESELRARKADQAKSNFLANMSHEIRTPLNGIVGMTQLVAGTSLTSQQRDFVETIRVSSDILLKLVNDILDLSKIEAQQLIIEHIAFDVNQLVQDVHKSMNFAAQKKGLQFNCILSTELNLNLQGDPTRVRQVILNLVSNAIKFTQQGSVSVQTLVVRTDEKKLKFRAEVHDTGIGIKPEASANLFKPFSQADASTTRKFGGTGLGLAICKSLIGLMDGEIGVKNSPQGGSIFWFELELAVDSFRKVQEPVANSEPKVVIADWVPDGRILVAEDNAINAMVIDALLANLGYQVTIVGNGLEALAALRKQTFDLVLMDCQMPEMDGYETTRQIRAAAQPWSDIAIIALTANAMKNDLDLCLQAGMNDYLTKPIRQEYLAETLQRWLMQIKKRSA